MRCDAMRLSPSIVSKERGLRGLALPNFLPLQAPPDSNGPALPNEVTVPIYFDRCSRGSRATRAGVASKDTQSKAGFPDRPSYLVPSKITFKAGRDVPPGTVLQARILYYKVLQP